MDLRHLRYFVTVAEEKNFTRAAEKLFIAQPPLSRQVRQLEEELGVNLFVPGARPLELTEAGTFLYAHATQLLIKASDVKTMTRRIGCIHGTLNIGYVASTLYGFLPEIIRKFKKEAPELSVVWHEMGSVQQLEALKTGKIDVGFGRLRIEDAAIRRILLREEKLMAALPVEHSLTQKQGQLSLLDLVEDTLIVYPRDRRPSFADQVLSIFADYGLKPANVMEVRELQIALGMVAAGEGVSIVPTSLYGLRRNDVQYMALSDVQAVSPIIMSVRNMDPSDSLRAILDVVYQVYDSKSISYTRESL
ncbi:LysR family transcriptional regulator [Neisseria leonii]|uniref:LysR family transcriptional regulator n=1 Tax=Neisseria leonii TaxID=2995413 RepID=UPI00237B12E7|nr:LysR family transcriptional regulator [Neisseria sp. 3986]MDD9325040.1 LysR family transcriptional regulator [Neisseria sp. 3986]